jgi:multidrug resistance efflux pump
MVELILATYGLGCWLVFKKFKLVPINTYTVSTAVLGGIFMLFGLAIVLSIYHPVSHNGRVYSIVTQIVPQVRGTVVDVPVTANKPLKEGDVLFQIDPKPYQIEVERLEAQLASMNTSAAQIDARLAAAEAATAAARSNLLVSESDYDRQARIKLANSQAQIEQIQSRLTLAKENLARSTRLLGSGAISQREYDTDVAQVDSLTAELLQAQSDEKSAQETIASGSDRVKTARDELKRAEAAELEARIARDSEIEGVNPDVRQAMAELDRKRWELEQTTIRAPGKGYVTYVALRPGQMATPLALTNAMLFVPNESRQLIATFTQNAITNFEPGLDAELAFKAYPGRVFKAKIARIVPIIPEGQFINSRELQSVTPADAPGQIPVVFEYGEDVAALDLPTGAQASIAVYTHKFRPLAIVRKVILRIKSWENYAPFMSHFDALH